MTESEVIKSKNYVRYSEGEMKTRVKYFYELANKRRTIRDFSKKGTVRNY
jgi:hypothetical protein